MNTIHIELTSKCQLGCPMCGRNIMGDKINPLLNETELYLDDIKQILPPEVIRKLDRVYLCGNYGEPIVARDCLSIVKYIRECNSEILIGINTNGSARPAAWWKDLAQAINTKGQIRFGIDGLKDTNHLYRQNSDFDMIMTNVAAFISAGGEAHWDYLVFEHNEHQVEDAEKLANDMGFSSFNVKSTTRFRADSRPVMNKGAISHYIKPTSIGKYHNAIVEFKKENYTKIECKTLNNNEVYLSADGHIFPCCWIAGQVYSYYNETARNEVLDWISNIGGLNSIDGRLHDIFEINDTIYNSLAKTWNNIPLTTCQHTCGMNIDKFKVQFK